MLDRLRSKRNNDGGLAKYLYLTDKQLVYRLITSPESAPLEGRLEAFYRQLEVLRPERNSAVLMYAVFFAGCLLSKFNLVSSVSAVGLSVLPIALKHVLIVGYSISQLRLSMISSKCGYISGIFDHRFYMLPADKRADMLARYPLALDTMKYYIGQIGSLPHTASMRTPKRMLSMLFLVASGLAVYIAFSIWLFSSLAVEIWMSTTPLPGFWSKSVVVVSLAIAMASYLLPTDLLFKRSYMHIGLVKMMNNAHDTNRPRYQRYFKWTNALRSSD